MTVITKENIRPFDVDQTLICDYTDVFTQEAVSVKDPVEGGMIRCRINQAMVRMLKEEKQRGGYVIVWSRGGWEWANNVVEALDLIDYVDLVLSKPMVYFDDSDVSTWLKDRVYIGPDVNYRK